MISKDAFPIACLKELDWQIEQSESRYSFRTDLHPYFAKFPDKIPRNFILGLSKSGDTVLDPFCGSGTTLVEALLNERNAIGIDTNPIACLISRVKTSPPTESELALLNRIKSEILANTSAFYGQHTLDDSAIIDYSLPDIPNHDKWFQKNVMHEIAIIFSIIQSVRSNKLRDFLSVTLSSIIVKVSNQQNESRYSSTDKNIQPLETRDLFLEKMWLNSEIVKRYQYSSDMKSKIIEADSRKLELESDSVDLVVTSPPYLNAWDYHLYQRFRLFWFGRSPSKLKKREIGAHLRHSYMDKSVDKYISDMRQCFQQFVPAVKKHCYICMVNGRAVVKGKRINTSNLLVQIAKDYGCKLRMRIERPVHGPNYGRRAGLEFRAGKKKEDLLVFERC